MTHTQDIAGRLAGVLAPVVTPFDPRTGELDRPGFERNVLSHHEAGLHGVIVAGSTGEAALLDEAERAALVGWARAVLPSHRLVVAGAGAESTRASVRLARQAAAEGADAVIVVAPHYYGDSAMTARALGAHYRRVADESPVPVVLYNIPQYTHFALSPALVRDLAAHGNVAGIKDSSGDLDLLGAYLGAQSASFQVLTGSGASLAPALARGARGGIVAVATFAPGLALELYDASSRGDESAASSAQRRLGPLAKQIVGGLGVAGVKAALDQVGLVGGPPRPPLLPLDAADREQVAQWLRDAELLAVA